jgi:transposase-like protein
MSREVHVRFCERPGVKFLRPTHPYIKVQGRWCYLYRAIDRSGALVDVRLSETRDMEAAKAFFRSAKIVTTTGCGFRGEFSAAAMMV